MQITVKYDYLVRYNFVSNGGVFGKTIFKHYSCLSDTAWDNAMMVASAHGTSDGGFVSAIEFAVSDTIIPFFFVKYDDTGCDSTIEYCKNPTGMKPFNNLSSLNIYPNPAKGTLFIAPGSAFTSGTTFSIYDVSGKMVRQAENVYPGNDLTLDISSLTGGTYLLYIEAGGERTKRIFIKD
jgi:hypothetical protein